MQLSQQHLDFFQKNKSDFVRRQQTAEWTKACVSKATMVVKVIEKVYGFSFLGWEGNIVD